MAKADRQKIVQWPVASIEPHPRNRKVNVHTVRFDELRASVKAKGVQEALLVRALPDYADRVQCLSGHRRRLAAELEGLATVPVINLGAISDAEAVETMTLGNLHEELTPLEEGERAALLLETHGEDAAAVARPGSCSTRRSAGACRRSGRSTSWRPRTTTSGRSSPGGRRDTWP
jgi:ParB/RepB/Spo0J family partition protein